MFLLKYSSRFKKDLKPYRHDKVFLAELENVLDLLIIGRDLPEKHHHHQLIGEFKGCFECHIKPDIILVYKIKQSELMVLLLRIGSHANLF